MHLLKLKVKQKIDEKKVKLQCENRKQLKMSMITRRTKIYYQSLMSYF